MKSLQNLFVLFIFCCCLLSPVTNAQDNMDESTKAWMEYMTPGEAHSMLAKSVGEWNTETKFWMQPGTEPMVSNGKAVNEMILGGRYLQAKHTGTAWGMPMEGFMLMGYDNATQQYTSIWIDNLGTGTYVSKGIYDPETKIVNWSGTMVDPMSKKEITVREVMNIKDDNHHILEMYMTHEGQEFKSMEITFTR